MIPPPGRCRPGQGSNLQLSSYDERVFRSNRTLTASEIVSGRNQAKFPGALPACRWRSRPALVFAAIGSHHGTGFDLERSSFTFTAQKLIREKNRQGSPGALPAPHSRVMLTLVFASQLAGGNGETAAMRLGGEVASSSLPEKNPRRKPTRDMTCSTIELPPRDGGEDRTRTDNGALIRRSNPDLTAWKLESAAGIAPA